MTARDEVLLAAKKLAAWSIDGKFTIGQVVETVRASGSGYRESTIRTHVISRMCANAPEHHTTRYADLVRVDRGIYRLN